MADAMDTETAQLALKLSKVGPAYAWFHAILSNCAKNLPLEVEIKDAKGVIITPVKEMNAADLLFNLHIGGALRSFMYYGRWKAAGSKANNKMIAKIEAEGIEINAYHLTKVIKKEGINTMIKLAEEQIVEHFPEWKVSTAAYGTISQIINLTTVFSYNFKVSQLGEMKHTFREPGGLSKDVQISEYGFDPNKHAQLAHGLLMKPIEASTQKTGLGFAAAVVFYHQAKDLSMKNKWISAIEYHLAGFPRKKEILQTILRGGEIANSTNCALADYFLLVGDRSKHRIGIPPYVICNMIGGKTFDKDKVTDVNFSNHSIFSHLRNTQFIIPSSVDEDHTRYLCSLAITGMMYDDLGILKFMIPTNVYNRATVKKIFFDLRRETKNLRSISVTFKNASDMRKAHGYELHMAEPNQLSSEPVTMGKRKRLVGNLKEFMKRNDGEYSGSGEIPEYIRKRLMQLREKIPDEGYFGTKSWYNTETKAKIDDIPSETGSFHFENVADLRQ